jgi:hypothetical protein
MKKLKSASNLNVAHVLALQFAYECGRRGAIISAPLSGDARYDFVVDTGRSGAALFRVKVVKATQEPKTSYYAINTQRVTTGKQRKKIPYQRHELDLIVTRVEDAWYFFSQPHSLTSNQRIEPTQANPKKNNWADIRLPAHPIADV